MEAWSKRSPYRADGSVGNQVCPNCDYAFATFTFFCDTRCKHIFCMRCGYELDEEIDEAASDFPGKIVWTYTEGGGEGAIMAIRKDDPGMDCVRTIKDGTIEYLKANLFILLKCLRTFEKDGEWFIED